MAQAWRNRAASRRGADVEAGVEAELLVVAIGLGGLRRRRFVALAGRERVPERRLRAYAAPGGRRFGRSF